MCTLDPVITSYKDLINRAVDPELDGPPKPGRIYFTGKIYASLTQGQKIRTGSLNPESRRKNQKSRPWLVLYARKDGNLAVISLTTRNNSVWGGLEGDDVNSFLPLGETPSFPGRDQVELKLNSCGIFKATSLIFLEVVKVVPPSSLGYPVGEITPKGLALVRRERQKCALYWGQQPRERQICLGHLKRPINALQPQSTFAINTRPRANAFVGYGGEQHEKFESKGEVWEGDPSRQWGY